MRNKLDEFHDALDKLRSDMLFDDEIDGIETYPIAEQHLLQAFAMLDAVKANIKLAAYYVSRGE